MVAHIIKCVYHIIVLSWW